MAFLGALNNCAVSRLKTNVSGQSRWKGVSEDLHDYFEQAMSIMNSSSNFRQYRKMLQSFSEAGTPCVPFLGECFVTDQSKLTGCVFTGTFLTDLTFACDGNKTYVDEAINQSKLQILSKILRNFRTLQDSSYSDLESDPALQYLLQQSMEHTFDEDQAWQMSLICKPSSSDRRRSSTISTPTKTPFHYMPNSPPAPGDMSPRMQETMSVLLTPSRRERKAVSRFTSLSSSRARQKVRRTTMGSVSEGVIELHVS